LKSRNTALYAILFGLTHGAFGGTLLGAPTYQLPGSQTTLNSVSPIFPVGTNAYFWSSDFLNFTQVGPAVFQFSTDQSAVTSQYTLLFRYKNLTGEDWESVRFEIVASGDDASLYLLGSGLEDDLIVDSRGVDVSFGADTSVFLGVGPSSPARFNLRVTPTLNVPEPGTMILLFAVGLLSVRRSRA
jgi:hypothetical protein